MDNQNEEYQPKRLTATGIVRTGAGQLGGFLVASGTPTIKIYDSVDNSGTIILNTMQTAAATPYPLPVQLIKGCYAEITGTADITFFFR